MTTIFLSCLFMTPCPHLKSFLPSSTLGPLGSWSQQEQGTGPKPALSAL
jgi:hypothetical protein